MTAEFCVMMTTTGSAELAGTIARALLEDRLAACVQIMPVQSHYVWRDQIQNEAESLLFIKAKSERYAEIAAAIRRLHDYEVPEIIRLDIAEGDPAYLGWMASTLR